MYFEVLIIVGFFFLFFRFFGFLKEKCYGKLDRMTESSWENLRKEMDNFWSCGIKCFYRIVCCRCNVCGYFE